MADVSGASDGKQAAGSDASERASLALLSRFLGAVFLVLLGVLLLLDRALLYANHNQATLDARSASLLTEAFISARSDLLDRVVQHVVAQPDTKDSAALRRSLGFLLRGSLGARHVWARNAAGGIIVDVDVDSTMRPLSQSVGARLQRVRPGNGLSVMVMPGTDARSLIALSRPLTSSGSGDAAMGGLIVDSEALRAWLERMHPATRLTLAVLAGNDSVLLLGDPAITGQSVGEGRSIVRLPNGGTWRVTTTHVLTTRSLRWALWTFGIFGVLFLAVGLLREQRRAQSVADRSLELERLYSDVKRANQAKSEFLANVSHELRTPLNAIVGFVELLRDGFYGDLSPRQVPPVDRIAASATHLRHLVDQVLDIAKIAAGRLEVHQETIVLRPFVLNVASELESLVSEKGLAFSLTVGASLPRVRTDPTHLRQILINLIGNAVKYTQTGTISVRARLVGAPKSAVPPRPSATATEDVMATLLLARAPKGGIWVALQIVDTGMGVAASDLGRIFDEFEQVNAGPRGDSMQRGTGLGLAISRRLARLLGGDISVESEAGRGSTFTVWLPVAPSDLTHDRVEAREEVLPPPVTA